MYRGISWLLLFRACRAVQVTARHLYWNVRKNSTRISTVLLLNSDWVASEFFLKKTRFLILWFNSNKEILEYGI